jgi:hypothetical protein
MKTDKKTPISATISPDQRRYVKDHKINLSKLIQLSINRFNEFGFAFLYEIEVVKKDRSARTLLGDVAIAPDSEME